MARSMGPVASKNNGSVFFRFVEHRISDVIKVDKLSIIIRKLNHYGKKRDITAWRKIRRDIFERRTEIEEGTITL
jgi:hypothetical protein